MAGETTAVLAQFASALKYEDIPQRTREYCKDILLDTLACAVAGHQGEETHQLAAFASGAAQSNESSVIGGDRLSLAGATMLNGYLITAVTMCDIHRSTLTHVTPEVDAAGARDRRARRLVRPRSAGRTRSRLRNDDARRRGPRLSGVPRHAAGMGRACIGPFGAAAAVGRLIGLDAETMARAFGLAGSQAAGTFAAWGTPTVKFHQCRGALSGLMAALLAQQNSWPPGNS